MSPVSVLSVASQTTIPSKGDRFHYIGEDILDIVHGDIMIFQKLSCDEGVEEYTVKSTTGAPYVVSVDFLEKIPDVNEL